MTKASPFLSSANAGELSPRMDARVDFEKYPAGVSRGLNLVCLPHGGVTKRPGTRHVKEVKTSSSATALIPFDPVASQAYVIELGATYARFFRNQQRIDAATVTTVVTNGTFPANVAGWTDQSTGSATISWVGGAMALNGAQNGYAWGEQPLSPGPFDLGVTHVVRFQVISAGASRKITVQVGSGSTSYDIYQAIGLGVGWHCIAFSIDGPAAYLQFINEQANVVYIDDVEILSGVAVELPSPYAAADVAALRTTQSADVLYLFHGTYQPYKLQRFGDRSWSLVKVYVDDGPWGEINPETDLGDTELVVNGSFAEGIRGWTESVTGDAFVDHSTSNGYVFLRRHGAAGTSAIRQAVATGASAAVHVIHFQIVGGGQVEFRIGTAAGLNDIVAAVNYSAGWYTVEFTPGAATFHLQFFANQDDNIAGGVGACFCFNTGARLLKPAGTTGSVNVTALGAFRPFRSTDVGRLLRFEYPGREPGWGIITSVTNDQACTIWLMRDVPVALACEVWRMGEWSPRTGWPAVGSFYQQRLIAARSGTRPQTLWGSQSGDFENMRPDSWVEGATTVEDDDALNFTLAAQRVSPILWLSGNRQLVVGTASGQLSVTSKGPALTPLDFSSEPQTSVKAADAPPVNIDANGIFIHKGNRSVYDIGFNYEIDGFRAADTTILASHIARGTTIDQIVYQEEPLSHVWARFANGKMGCLAYKRAHNVVGWTSIEIAGSAAGDAVVESMAVIPGASGGGQTYSSIDRDEVWMVVRRTINGATKRYIEVMEGFYEGPNQADYVDTVNWLSTWKAAQRTSQVEAFYVDSGITYSGAAVTTITGLTHLEGETVHVWGGGSYLGAYVVSGGQITGLSKSVTVAQVGLAYDWLYRSLKLPYGSPSGAGVGITKTVSGIVLVLLDSVGFQARIDRGGTDQGVFTSVEFRDPSDPMDLPLALFTGEVPVGSDGGYSTDPRIVMKGSVPGPWTLLGITPKVDTKPA